MSGDAEERDGLAREATAAATPDEQSPGAARPADAPPAPADDELPARAEALLFVSDGAVEESALARALGVTRRQLDRALDGLGVALRDGGRGVRLQRGPEGAQLVTAPEAAEHVEYFLGLEASRRLSTAALETLAIVAYRQPVTRGTIETIRGVSADAALATLRARGLIAEGGRAEGPGRPVLWVTTQRFLRHFGLERPSDLPPLPDDLELPGEPAAAQLPLEAEPTGDVGALARAAESALAGRGAGREDAAGGAPEA
ncbi:MAG: SMC-Scp complex subunit ScpB [Chloroflexi bacterium]|nr:SMC-Scp complex subunit ScpB [Chloroflexota bacterium]